MRGLVILLCLMVSATVVYSVPACGQNEEFRVCSSQCDTSITCATYESLNCLAVCAAPACNCVRGTVRVSSDGPCVPVSDC